MVNDQHSTRIIVDLQAGQTLGSFQRGIGNYSCGFFDHLAKQLPAGDVFALTSDALPHQVDCSAVQPNRRIVMSPQIDWHTPFEFQGGNRESIGSVAYSAQSQAYKPDIIHLSHSFIGLGDQIIGPGITQPIPGQVISTTLYDLIPLIFSEHYLSNPIIRGHYYYQLEQLRRFDLLLAISESTRQDAINYLGIEPSRIVTIHGGISSIFKPAANRESAIEQIRSSYRLRQKILLYTGGDDYRKNIDGLIEGFAKTPQKIKDATTLVIVAKMSEPSRAHYENLARDLGIPDDSLLFTGYIPDDKLLAFYQSCNAFIFPSKYEGLGLPVLEAMSCGAPVIGSNNSSIREIIAREDAMFDVNNPESMANAITQVLTNQNLAEDLSQYGMVQSSQFNWENSAKTAKEAFFEALQRKREAGVSFALSGWLPRKRIAVLTPMPPSQSGIADYSADFLPYLNRHFDIDLYLSNHHCEDEKTSALLRIFDIKDFAQTAQAYDAIIYEVGNSDFHTHMLELMEQYPGVVTLHDAYMSGILSALEHGMNQPHRFANELLYSHGPRARKYLPPEGGNIDDIRAAIIKFPTTKRILDHALGVISHSPFNLKVAKEHFPEGWLPPYRTIPQMIAPDQHNKNKERVKKELGLPENSFVIATFGHIAVTKVGDLLLRAFEQSKELTAREAHLVYVGKLSEDEFGDKLKKLIKKSSARKRIKITGFVSKEDYHKYLQISDIAVQLRSSSRGGTPRSVLDCLANNVPVVLNNYASFKDYPDQVVAKIPGVIKADDIQRKLDQLTSDSNIRLEYAQAGKEYIRTQHDPAIAAARYAAAIHEFIERDKASQATTYASELAPHVGSDNTQTYISQLTSTIISPTLSRRRLLITGARLENAGRKIQKPLVQLTKAMYQTDVKGIEPIAVEWTGSGISPPSQWLAIEGILATCENGLYTPPLEFQPDDVVINLFTLQHFSESTNVLLNLAKENNISIVNVICPWQWKGLLAACKKSTTNEQVQWIENSTATLAFLFGQNTTKESCVALDSISQLTNWISEKQARNSPLIGKHEEDYSTIAKSIFQLIARDQSI